MNDITYLTDAQGEIIGERNRDTKYPWKERKMLTFKLARLYELAGWQDYANRVAACSRWLQYDTWADGTQKLVAANFCHLRLCPICITRRAKKAAYQLSRVLDKVQAEHDGTMYLFLTLTVQNCQGYALGATLGQLTKAWDRLMKHRQVQRSVKGWYRAIEITRNGDRKDRKWYGTYHPHIHAILAVEPAYFAKRSGLYITKSEWIERWQKAMGVSYRPSVQIQVTKAKGEYSGGRAAAVEAAKYAVKDEDYIDPNLPEAEAVDIVETYTKALHRRRLVAFGGWLKEAAKALGADNPEDGDLVHVEQETIRGDVADLIEEYQWHFGAGDYVLTDRRPNPLKVVRENGGKVE